MAKKHKKAGPSFNAFDLISFAWKKKWILAGVSVAAIIVSVIVSLNITPRFRSQLVLFPAASISISQDLISTQTVLLERQDILSFGEQEETERMLQILNSGKIKDYIINKYDLLTHYGIDLSQPYPYTRLDNKIKSNIKYRRTEYNSIEISVMDTDPDYAANIANDIGTYVDSAFHDILRQRAEEVLRIMEQAYESSETEIKTLSDSLQRIRDLGVIDFNIQASSLSSAYTEALAAGNSIVADDIQNRMNILSRYANIYNTLTQKLNSEIARSIQLRDRLAAYRISAEQYIPQVYIVDRAAVPERKAVPKRSVIVFISTLSAFAFAFLVLLVFDNIKNLK